ncbi:hypothetical protein CR513_25736, partial [Mucuna pruriens]
MFPYVITYENGKENIMINALSRRYALHTSLHDEFLFKKNKLCVPIFSLHEMLVKETHGRRLMRHFEIKKTSKILNEHFYLPNIKHDVQFALFLSSPRSLDKNLMNLGQLGRRYDFKKQSIRAIFKQNGSHILKNAMNKIRNGQDNELGFQLITRALLPRKIELLIRDPQPIVKYQQCQEELQQRAMEEGTYGNDSSFASINDDNVYYGIVGGKNDKGDLIRSTCLQPTLIEMPMVEQVEEMCEMIHKLSNELITKEAKEKSL